MVSVDPDPTRAGPSRGEPLLDVRDLVVEFPADGVRVLDRVSLTVQPGETLGVVGESGSGKSMTALAVLGLLPPGGRASAGQVRFADEDLLQASGGRVRELRGSEIAMIFQDPLSALNPVVPVGRQVVEVARRRGQVSGRAARALAVELLERVEIPDAAARAGAYPHQLSGGMRQRAVTAMALAGRPRLILADEPTTALDVTVQARILQLLKRLQEEERLAMMLISHDLRVMAHVADRVVVMYAGRIMESGAAAPLLRRPLHPYTEALVRSVPTVRTRSRIGQPIPGSPPSLIARPTGCPFHPRCPRARERCQVEEPPLREVVPGRLSACHFAEELVA